MSNPSVVTLQLAAASANAIALSQTPLSASNLTLAGALATAGVATMDVPRRVLVTAAGNEATKTFTVYGTDRNGNAITDTVTGLNISSGYTALDFATVTRVAVSAATAGAVTVGTNGVGSSAWVLDDPFKFHWALAVAVSLSGTVTYTVEHTYDDPNDMGTTLTAMPEQFAVVPASYIPARAWPHVSLVAMATDGEGQYPDKPVMAHRITITAGTGRAVMQSVQAGIN